MAAELRKLAQDLKLRGFDVGGSLLEDSAHSWEKAGLIPNELQSVVPLAEARSLKNPEVKTDAEIPLGNVISEYKKGPLTPELVNSTWQNLWKIWGERVNHTFQVPTCDRTTGELARLQQERKAILLIPDELYTPKGLVLLGHMFPELGRLSVDYIDHTYITNDTDKGGSIDIEMFDESNSYNEKQAQRVIEKQGRNPQRLATYIVGSQFNKLLTGYYFDEGRRFSLLSGSQAGKAFPAYGLQEGKALLVQFSDNGFLFISWLSDDEKHIRDRGIRSEGVKRV